MAYFKFAAERIVEAESESQAEDLFAGASSDFAAEAECERLPDDYWKPKPATDSRQRVLITVRGGVAEAHYDESKVMVEIFDYDEYEAKGKDPDPYLNDLVGDWDFPDPRKAGVEPAAADAVRQDILAHRRTLPRMDPDYELYTLVTEDAQVVAEDVLGRKLTENELGVVKHEIGDYIDWDEAMTLCIQMRIAREL